MATGKDLQQISRARIKTSQILLAAKDYEASAYMMGYGLEIALKAAACKSLRLDGYPSNTNNKSIDSYFMSHKFDQLLVISGLSDLFSLNGPPNSYKNWSEFVQEYPGDWPSMRYDPKVKLKFDSRKVMRLYNNLYEDAESIINTIIGKRRW